MFMGDNNDSAPHVVFVGSTGGFVAHTTIAAVNNVSLRVLAGEEDVAEQLGTFRVDLASDAGDLQSTGVLDSYGYERNLIGSSLQFKTSIAGVATQSIDKVVGLSGGGVVENEDVDGMDIESDDDGGDEDDDENLAVPEPTVVRGGFLVDQNGSVIGESKSSSRPASAIKRPFRPAPPRPSSSDSITTIPSASSLTPPDRPTTLSMDWVATPVILDLNWSELPIRLRSYP